MLEEALTHGKPFRSPAFTHRCIRSATPDIEGRATHAGLFAIEYDGDDVLCVRGCQRSGLGWPWRSGAAESVHDDDAALRVSVQDDRSIRASI